MRYEEIFNKVFNAIRGIEYHIGLKCCTSKKTINGRLNNLEIASLNPVLPYCETDIIIENNNFTVKYNPIPIGDTWVVNNDILIETDLGKYSSLLVQEGGSVIFVGNIGTLIGANNKYDGMTLTLTYFYRQPVLYYNIYIEENNLKTKQSSMQFLNLVIKDEETQKHQRVFINNQGKIELCQVDDEPVGENSFIDISNGVAYELYSIDGILEWRTIQ